MKKLSNCTGFILGVVFSMILFSFASSAFAASFTKNAQLVYNNIKITLNGQLVTPKDASGNVVEPFIIDGTTYLPVRAIGTALGISVDRDGATNTVKLTNGITQTEEQKVTEIRNWVVGDIWNTGFCDLSYYFYNGKSSTGQTMDPIFTMQQLEKSMLKKEGYDSYMRDLLASNQELSELWEKVSEQIEILYNEVKGRELIVGGQKIDTGLYNQYFSAFDKVFFDLVY